MTANTRENIKVSLIVGVMAVMGGLLWRGVQIQISGTVNALEKVTDTNIGIQLQLATVEGSQWTNEQQRLHEQQMSERIIMLLEAVHGNQVAIAKMGSGG